MVYGKKKFTGPTKAAILRGNQEGWLTLVTPYNADFVDELKSTIQPSHRRWDPVSKTWSINEIFLEELIPMLQRYYDSVETDLTAESTVPENFFGPVFDALKNLPNGGMDKVYKSLAQACHPDHGGSDELMSKLNQAYQEAK